MAVTKADQFNTVDTQLAEIAKALAHPARIRILKILTEMNVCMCGDIVDQLPLSQATVSQHLKELKRVGLIQGNVEGPKTCYCVDNAFIEQARKQFSNLFSKVCCGSGCK
ncbi:MAG: winged helix-turn-helix transcriptional regulator [Candidatus Marinimicrobia bacterium]|nr:winged helix-turn-helix transcriptional regulator [Candidatus Neomarinimicrobiota bacterium]